MNIKILAIQLVLPTISCAAVVMLASVGYLLMSPVCACISGLVLGVMLNWFIYAWDNT